MFSKIDLVCPYVQQQILDKWIRRIIILIEKIEKMYIIQYYVIASNNNNGKIILSMMNTDWKIGARTDEREA